MHRYAIALGSNLGDRLAYLRQGLALLLQRTDAFELCSSQVYDTDPVGGPEGQNTYLNAAVTFKSRLEPPVLLEHLLAIERQAGRKRHRPNEPRTLDLDLLLCDALRLQTPALTLPHPRMHLRAFVLVPLAEIAPDWVVPGLEQSVGALQARLGTAGVRPTGLRL
ncbi:2-amino-4-hydroxy-6-hydroxymethyldihydropteridine diphosphokinase [Meiothermus sp. QL-1]|uniref:2-amino-4-hydroxy-6- hydroxymethyldihydropteridine diphosphokinase n=1 Tax=Meiothermus sp. QL-1 TaxID=2058095 RepID=UPI000E0A4E09|nr:2-amino-4-hydroxy-6-hydroxymethyldihydropteridine diphosphokinase [Meiothermus sp. QL-1]RDI96332.1 2-amino-4-hydroxy-6-hydroxymethyldihydropteridine diphosphokinase [Meiothermus sp. QL-1]